MKKHLLLLAFTMLVVIPAWSQGDYKSMLVEGRSWKTMMVTVTWEIDRIYENEVVAADMCEAYVTSYVTYTVTGEAIVEGKTCYSINRSSFVIAKVEPERFSEVVELPNPADVFYMYEEDGKVYSYTPNFSDGWQLEFDGNLQPGEAMSNNRVVDHIDAINVNGEVYRRFTFKDGSCWIEGIGSSKYGMLNDINAEINSEITVFKMKTVSVYDNGNCIFETDDFNAEAQEISNSDDASSNPPTGINHVHQSVASNASHALFDLLGRRMETSNIKLQSSSTSEAAKPSANLKKGVYIRDGRKVVVK